jgi:hypothetical protein
MKYVQQLQLEKPKPMSRLLTNEEIDRAVFLMMKDVDRQGITPFPYFTAIAEAQDTKTRQATLKAVGEWLESRLKQDISNFTQGFITLGDIDTLKRGEMP